MSARNSVGWRAAKRSTGVAQRHAGHASNRSQVKTPAQGSGQTPFHLEAKTTGHSTPLARCYSALTRTRHWPTPEVKPRIPPVCIEDAPSVRSTDSGTPPDLLNPSKGLSMAKTACVSLQTALKFVPVPDLMKPAQISQTVRCSPSNQRFYTLCEVSRAEGNSFPSCCWKLLEQEQAPNSEPIKTITYRA